MYIYLCSEISILGLFFLPKLESLPIWPLITYDWKAFVQCLHAVMPILVPALPDPLENTVY